MPSSRQHQQPNPTLGAFQSSNSTSARFFGGTPKYWMTAQAQPFPHNNSPIRGRAGDRDGHVTPAATNGLDSSVGGRSTDVSEKACQPPSRSQDQWRSPIEGDHDHLIEQSSDTNQNFVENGTTYSLPRTNQPGNLTVAEHRDPQEQTVRSVPVPSQRIDPHRCSGEQAFPESGRRNSRAIPELGHDDEADTCHENSTTSNDAWPPKQSVPAVVDQPTISEITNDSAVDTIAGFFDNQPNAGPANTSSLKRVQIPNADSRKRPHRLTQQGSQQLNTGQGQTLHTVPNNAPMYGIAAATSTEMVRNRIQEISRVGDRGTIEMGRLRLLDTACQIGDFEFIVIHQLFCWTHIHKNLLTCPSLNGVKEIHNQSLRLLDRLLVTNDSIPMDGVEWFSKFPQGLGISNQKTAQLEALEQNVLKGLESMTANWLELLALSTAKTFPPSIVDVFSVLGVRSFLLRQAIMRMIMRTMWSGEHDACFQKCEDLLSSSDVAVLSNPRADDSAVQAIKTRYHQILSEHISHLRADSGNISTRRPGLVSSAQRKSLPSKKLLRGPARQISANDLVDTPMNTAANNRTSLPSRHVDPNSVSPAGQVRRVSPAEQNLLTASGAANPPDPPFIGQHPGPTMDCQTALSSSVPHTQAQQTPIHIPGPILFPRPTVNGGAQAASPGNGPFTAPVQPIEMSSRQIPGHHMVDTTRGQLPFNSNIQMHSLSPHTASTSSIPIPLANTSTFTGAASGTLLGSPQFRDNALWPNSPSLSQGQGCNPDALQSPSIGIGGYGWSESMDPMSSPQLVPALPFTALPQYLRSPQLVAADSPDHSWNSKPFRYVNKVHLPQTALNRDTPIQSWRAMVDSEYLQRIPSEKHDPLGLTMSIRPVRTRSLLFRIKGIRWSEPQSFPDLGRWMATDNKWPASVAVSLNGTNLQLKMKSRHGKDRPVDVTSMIKEGHNEIQAGILGLPENSKDQYLIGLEMIEVVDRDSLKTFVTMFHHAEAKQRVLQRFKETDPDLEILQPHIVLDLTDPYTSRIFQVPVRSRYCQHDQCFDLDTYLETRRLKAGGQPCEPDEFKCPICKGSAAPPSLMIDEFFLTVRNTLERMGRLDVKAIRVKEDGQWEIKEEEEAAGETGDGGDDPSSRPTLFGQRHSSNQTDVSGQQTRRHAMSKGRTNVVTETIEILDDD